VREPYIEKTKQLSNKEIKIGMGSGIKTNWPTDRLSQCNLKLNLRHCIANYRHVLSSERAPYMKNKERNCHSNKCNTWSPAPRGEKTPRRTGRLTVGRNVTSTSMAVSSVGLRPKSDSSVKDQKQLYIKLQTRPLVREGSTN
jgi:hypothetical protein